MKNHDERARLLEMVLATFEHKEITLSSGKKSNFYLDCRIPLMKPLGQKLAGEQMLGQLMLGPWVDAVGGMAVGAVPLVSAVLSAAAHHDPGTGLEGFFVRKETKKHGKGRQIEGGFLPGQTVALVEDTCTTGGSTLEALEIVEAAGGKVARVLCLVDRGEGAGEVFAERGIELEAIFTRDDLPV
ncbi:MAG: orotate phosphoribosyltransferase [bacterium]|nr:orotate phosphoribosyltransferase [bacterium]MCP5069341.1 orotate phosphoribosyltransferase [bacterium]